MENKIWRSLVNFWLTGFGHNACQFVRLASRLEKACTWAGTVLVAALFPCVVTALGYAQVPPATEGKALPDAYFERLRHQPDAFSFSKGYISLVQRLQENRERVAKSAAPAFDLAVANQQGGLVIAGTKLFPLITSVSQDLPNPPYNKSLLAQEYFDGPWPTGTLSSFYAAMSYGNLNVKGVVLDWQTLSHPADWYGGDDFRDVDGTDKPCNGLCSGSRVGQLITELLDKNRNIDWGQFDNDGPDKRANSGDDDGTVDFIVIVHPGIGGECGGTNNRHIWSHRGQLKYEGGVYVTPTPSATPAFGNIQINDYVIVPALACDGQHPNPIGIAAHEFGHAFDLPDLYDTSLVTVGGVGNWDLMATGAWGGDDRSPQTPTQMSAWSKERLGWISPIPVTADLADIALDPIATRQMAYKVPGSGSHYYLLSNRQKTGNDARLPKAGLLIEAVDPDRLEQAWTSNQVNADIANLGVQVIEADGATGLVNPIANHNSFRFSAGDVFPVSADQTDFDANSTPPSPGTFALCGIHLVGAIIHAKLLISSNFCPGTIGGTVGESAAPFAALADIIAIPGSAASQQHPAITSVERLLENPAAFEGHQVALIGIIENTGTNYFTHLNLSLTDQTGRTIPVKIAAPTELPPPLAGNPTPPHSLPISAYLNKFVKATGTIVSTEARGRGKTYVLHVTNVSPDGVH